MVRCFCWFLCAGGVMGLLAASGCASSGDAASRRVSSSFIAGGMTGAAIGVMEEGMVQYVEK